MAKLIDFQCRYADFSGISKDLAAMHNLSLPQAYMKAEDIAKLAVLLNANNPNAVCVLPFDPVLEAENLGAEVRYDDSSLGPRKEKEIVLSMEDLSKLPAMNITHGRLAETLKAIEILRNQDINAAIELHGPITILNGVADIMKMLMGWRKSPEIMAQFFDQIACGLVDIAIAARNAGCEILYYTDSPGSLNIIGPKYAKQLTEGFILPFLKKLDQVLDKDCLIHLCPKTSFMLAGCEKAVWKKINLDGSMMYQDACLSVAGKARFLGQRCRKDDKLKVSIMNYLELSE